VITPRITRLVRVPDLQGLQAFIGHCLDMADARTTAVIVPTRSAAEVLRDTIETRCLSDDRPAAVMPDLVTRGEFYDRLHARLSNAPRRLSDYEREVIFRHSALDAVDEGTAAPFRLRPGLLLEMLAFYDELRRRDRTVPAFERLLNGSLEPSADIDRGADRLLRLTRFLSRTFVIFEQRIGATDGVDEHRLRALLIDGGPEVSPTYRHVIVTVADQAADARGLWPADYDLLARLPRLDRLDIVATENALAAGYHQRVHDALPEIEEERWGTPAALPVLTAPAATAGDEARHWIVCRDREEELADVARSLKRPACSAPDRTAVVFQRPLPYLYLARQVFADAEIRYQAFDALPLAGEPFAAALDLVCSFVISEATRASIVELLASPHWGFEIDGRKILREDVTALDGRLKDLKYAGGWERLKSLAAASPSDGRGDRDTRTARAAAALRAAANAASELRALRAGESASVQLSSLLRFVAAHERVPEHGMPGRDGHLRARAAVLGVLESLRDAHLAHDDRAVQIGELLATVRRWIESQTFSPRTGSSGVLMVDAPAAAYADVDELRLVGLVDADWPDKSSRSIFYPPQLLAQLGWPSDTDRLAAGRARFHDLLRLPRVNVSVSTFTLEDDAIVPASVLLEEIDRAGLPVQQLTPSDAARVFLHEAIADEPTVASALEGVALDWLTLRMSRSPEANLAYHGTAGVREATAYSVSSLERYLECPFKYFAAHVLRLPEERTDESGLTPQERGQFLHEVFEAFFTEWQASGRGTITTANVNEAVRLFETITERELARLPESDRALERTHLLGSAAAAGLAERAFAFEIEQGGEVIERLLEHGLEGVFQFPSASGYRSLSLRAKADRIDLMADGTIRVVDYKLGKAPKPARALQLPVYGLCAQQSLDGRRGRSWKLGRAGYVAFREKNAFVALGASSSLDEAVSAGQDRMLRAIDAIERGEFPPNPDEPFLCTRCGYASVCRKDYVGDE